MSSRLISALITIIGSVLVLVLVIGVNPSTDERLEPVAPVEHRPSSSAVTADWTKDDEPVTREVTPAADSETRSRRATRGEIGEFREPLPDMMPRITNKNAPTIEIGAYKDPEGDYYMQSINSPSAIELGRWLDPDAHTQVSGHMPLREIGDRAGMPDKPSPRRTNDQPAINIGEPKEVPR